MTPLAPAWLVLPLAALAVLIITAHLRGLWSGDTPRRRRRIRTAVGGLLLAVTVLLAYALGVATPSRPRGFVLSWTAVAGLVTIVLVLAGIDALNSVRMHRQRARELRLRMHTGVARSRRQGREAKNGPDAEGP